MQTHRNKTMGPVRSMVMAFRIIKVVIKTLPKLQQQTKHIENPNEKARKQQQMLERTLEQIPEYRQWKRSRNAFFPKRPTLLQTDLKNKFLNDANARTPQAEPIAWQHQNLPDTNDPPVQKPSHTDKHTGYEDYPFLHELLK